MEAWGVHGCGHARGVLGRGLWVDAADVEAQTLVLLHTRQRPRTLTSASDTRKRLLAAQLSPSTSKATRTCRG